MWAIPLVLSINNHRWRFPCIWIVFSSITSLIAKRGLEKPMQGTTPRMVFKWFMLMFKVSFYVGTFGFITIIATFLGLNLVFGMKPSSWIDPGLMCVFYSLYYGIMARDLGEMCCEKMVTNIGYYKGDNSIPDKQLKMDVCAGKVLEI